jgi:maleylpyruvate isomerase
MRPRPIIPSCIPTACHVSVRSVSPSPSELARDVLLGRRAHATLLERLRGASFAAAEPSRLPGWNRAQVVTHLARNADGHRRMIEGAGRGEVLAQCEEIDAGADRSAAEVIDDLTTATAALEAAWDVTDWRGAGRRTLGGESPIDRLPFFRVREVSLHGFDLGIGIELADLDPLYVRLELSRMEMLWTARQPMGLTPLPPAALALTPTDRLGWLTGRIEVEGLRPAGIF